MRLVILKDKLISKKEIKELQKQFTELYQDIAEITPEFFIEETDYTTYPYYFDEDGDGRLDKGYIRKLTQDVHKRYSGEGTDHVVILIHEDNWKLKGIWGTCWSNVFYGYQTTLCRFDRDNMANSLGTLYHETHHSHDTFIRATTGVDILPVVPTYDWDRCVTHGKCNDTWDYIRYKENTESVTIIAPLLRQAYAKRLEIHRNKVTQMNLIVTLLQQIVILTRTLLYRKDGVPK